MKKVILLLLLSISIVGGVLAQTKPQQQSFVFKFVSGKDMFFVPYGGNDVTLEQIMSLVIKNKDLLKNAKMYISVSSYATKGNETQSSRDVANIQRNRIKSELITKCGITEDAFATDRYITEPYNGLKNVVVVMFPASVEKVRKILGDKKAAVVEQFYQDIESARIAKVKAVQAEKDKLIAEEKAKEQKAQELKEQKLREQEQLAKEQRQAAEKAEQERIAKELQAAKDAKKLPLTLRSNLLYFASGMVNAGVEYKSENSPFGYLLNGGYSPFSSTEWNKNLGGWFVAPEFRYYFGAKQTWFAGLQFLVGGYNVKLSDTGYQGTVVAGGITGGYRLTISKLLDIDFSLGLGYGNLKYDSYTHNKPTKTNIYKNKDVSKGKFIPTQAGVSLIFKL